MGSGDGQRANPQLPDKAPFKDASPTRAKGATHQRLADRQHVPKGSVGQRVSVRSRLVVRGSYVDGEAWAVVTIVFLRSSVLATIVVTLMRVLEHYFLGATP
jgi:hypothetical protein